MRTSSSKRTARSLSGRPMLMRVAMRMEAAATATSTTWPATRCWRR